MMALDRAIIARRTPVLIKLVEVIRLVLVRMLLPVRIIRPDREGLLVVARFERSKELIHTVLGRNRPEEPPMPAHETQDPKQSDGNNNRNNRNDNVAVSFCAADIIRRRIEQGHGRKSPYLILTPPDYRMFPLYREYCVRSFSARRSIASAIRRSISSG